MLYIYEHVIIKNLIFLCEFCSDSFVMHWDKIFTQNFNLAQLYNTFIFHNNQHNKVWLVNEN